MPVHVGLPVKHLVAVRADVFSEGAGHVDSGGERGVLSPEVLGGGGPGGAVLLCREEGYNRYY